LRFDAERAPLFLAAAFLALALVGIGAAEITGDDESREVGIVQDVLAGHWLWPRFNDELIPDKPVLTHWLGAAACAIAGFSEGAVRFPSAVAGAFVVGWTAWFGIRALGFAPGIAAALLLATFPAFFERARLDVAFPGWHHRSRPDRNFSKPATSIRSSGGRHRSSQHGHGDHDRDDRDRRTDPRCLQGLA